jgi:multidrug transporter EmrE-like cation transporter
VRQAMTNEQIPISQAGEASWHLAKRILFRFAFCYIVLYYLPSVLQVIPGAGWLLSYYDGLWNRIEGLTGVYLFNLDAAWAIPHPTGSGDTALAYLQQGITLILAIAGGILWTLFDRRRPHYIGLHGWLRVLARYALSFALFSYAISKIIPTQFSHLQSGQLIETYGQSSPMALLWNFMGFSTAYTIFGGCAELIPAVLLLFRRTALLGSIIASVVMLNVVMLNFCYDVPVKLYSLNLLLLAIFLTLPEGHKLLRVFVFNLSAAPSNLRQPSFEKRWIRHTVIAVKIAILATFLGQSIHSEIVFHRTLAARTPAPRYPLTSRGFHWVQEYPYNR